MGEKPTDEGAEDEGKPSKEQKAAEDKGKGAEQQRSFAVDATGSEVSVEGGGGGGGGEPAGLAVSDPGTPGDKAGSK